MKSLYKVKVLNFLQYGGDLKIYWVYAHSEFQAKKIVAQKFNKDYLFTSDNYVEMKIDRVKVRIKDKKHRKEVI